MVIAHPENEAVGNTEEKFGPGEDGTLFMVYQDRGDAASV